MTADRLQRVIAASGLSARRFAREVLGRDERTVRRWLTGEVEIPESARYFLERLNEVREQRNGLLVITLNPPSPEDSIA